MTSILAWCQAIDEGFVNAPICVCATGSVRPGRRIVTMFSSDLAVEVIDLDGKQTVAKIIESPAEMELAIAAPQERTTQPQERAR